MDFAKPSNSLMLSFPMLFALDGEFMFNVSFYRSTVGALRYVTLTQPDICYLVNKFFSLCLPYEKVTRQQLNVS